MHKHQTSAHPNLDAAGHRAMLADRPWGAPAPEPSAWPSPPVVCPSTIITLPSAATGATSPTSQLPPASLGPTCQVHVHERESGRYQRQPYPAELAAGVEDALPHFREEGRWVAWYFPGADTPLILANPLWQ